MRSPRTGMILGALLAPLLAVGLLPGSSTNPTNPGKNPGSKSLANASDIQLVAKRKKHRRSAAARPQNWSRRTVHAIRGVNKVTVAWPARARATGYTVAWSPLISKIPRTPAACTYPCKRRFTRGTSMVLSTTDLTTYGRRVSSASGNTSHLKIFSHNGSALNWTSVTYPWDAWVTPSRTTATNWLPTLSSQMPLPLPPRAGANVAVSTFNVLSASTRGVKSWPYRAARVAAQINNTGASIVATQEASNSNIGVGYNSAQFNDLAARLRPRGWALADNRNWDAALGLSRSWSTQATRTYYKSSVWSQVTRGALLTHTPIAGQYTGVNVDRWVSWTKLRARANASTQICVLNAHLISTPGTAGAVHRNAEIAQILSELNNPRSTVRRVGTRVGAACAGTPMVLAGDLNSAQEHAPYGNMPQATMLGAGFVDTKNAGVRVNTRLSGTGPVTGWHPTWGTQLDYLLTRGMGGAKAFKVNMTHPRSAGSDHYPVTALVSVPRS